MMYSLRLQAKNLEIRSNEMFRLFIYKLKQGVRNKSFILWNLLFPFVLGTIFYCCFSNLYSAEKMSGIKIAMEKPETQELQEAYDVYKNILSEIKYNEKDKMFDINEVSSKKADELLEDEKVDGIISVHGFSDIRLKVESNDVNQSILTSIVTALREGVEIKEYTVTKSLQGKNKDPYIQYFYNILAMLSVMTGTGVMISLVKTQANYNPIGIRVESSPVSRVFQSMMSLFAMTFLQLVILSLSIFYYIHILHVDFGCADGYVYLTSAIASVFGCSLGFLVACVGNASEQAKNNFITAIVVGGGFLSGLMIPDMRIRMEQMCPIVNRINPSALITDAFYSLNVYGVGARYERVMFTMIGMSVLFIVLGFVFKERRGYASI